MPTECAFTLPTGKKCRCVATRDHAFCRHHGAPRSGKPRRDPNVWSRLACWRDLGRSAPTADKAQAVFDALEVLRALHENSISDRTAGRLLRTLLQRWDQVPLMPAPETGWIPDEPDPRAASHAVPTASRTPAPAYNQTLTPGQLEQWIAQISSQIAAGRP
jgi:hypothetical protein